MSRRSHHLTIAAVPAAVAAVTMAAGLPAQPTLRSFESTVGSLLGEGHVRDDGDLCIDAFSVDGKYVMRQGPNYCLPSLDDAEGD